MITLVSREGVSFLLCLAVITESHMVIKFGDKALRNSFASWSPGMGSFVIAKGISAWGDSREYFQPLTPH